MFRRLIMVQLLFLLVELISGLYMYATAVSGAGVAVHGVFGVAAGALGVALIYYARGSSDASAGRFVLLGFVFVLVAAASGLGFVASHYKVAAYTYVMGAAWLLSSGFYSMPLSSRKSTPDH